jgi:hypothetical protein
VSTADGSVLGTTQIVDSGPPATHWNLVIVGDGYQVGQLAQYATDAQRVADAVLATPPFDRRARMINVYRVDVSSTDGGADDPADCTGGAGVTARTYFDASFCTAGIRRLLVVDSGTAIAVAGAQVPQWNMVFVIVNSAIYGGSGAGGVAVLSVPAEALEIALHEMGHSAFGLADEYDYYRGCGIDTDSDNHPPGEPSQVNVTTNADRATIKWKDLIQPATLVPTMTNPDCAQCDRRPSSVPVGTVGAFEGAHYYHCRAFRPEHRCRMFELNQPFCAVCSHRILSVLPTEVPDVRGLHLTLALQRLKFAGLKAQVSGAAGPGLPWVVSQSPAGGTVVAAETLVDLFIKFGSHP